MVKTKELKETFQFYVPLKIKANKEVNFARLEFCSRKLFLHLRIKGLAKMNGEPWRTFSQATFFAIIMIAGYHK